MEFFKPGVRYDFMGMARICGILSIVAVVLSWGLVFTKGLNFGIDFAGGTEALIAFNEPVDVGELRETVEGTGLEKPEVVTYGLGDEGRYFVRSQTQTLLTEADAAKLKAAVEKVGAPTLWDTKDETGEEIRVQFGGPKDVAALQSAVAEAGIPNVQVTQQSGGANPVYVLNVPGVRSKLTAAMNAAYADKFKSIDRLETVGSAVGREMREQGALALLYAMFGVVLYIVFRFDARYGPGAAVALVHDVSLTIGIYALLGLEFSLPIVAALLSLVGYSINDTVVVYDRIRENVQAGVGRDLNETINISVSETLGRTINTSLASFFGVLSIYIFCGGTVQNFSFAMMCGIIIGTYSSIYVANPLVLMTDRYLAKRGSGGATKTTTSASASRP
jgi:preprotein translocase subunit SecF